MMCNMPVKNTLPVYIKTVSTVHSRKHFNAMCNFQCMHIIMCNIYYVKNINLVLAHMKNVSLAYYCGIQTTR
jgi:hypothetical protein